MAVETTPEVKVDASEPNQFGYRTFRLGEFEFSRNEYFVYVRWPTGSHVMSADAFLKALQRDVAWDFFYGIVNFDGVVGTVNHYGTVDLFAGRYNDAYRKADGRRSGRRTDPDRRERLPDEPAVRGRPSGRA